MLSLGPLALVVVVVVADSSVRVVVAGQRDALAILETGCKGALRVLPICGVLVWVTLGAEDEAIGF